jgi:hypothetical protein
MDLPGYRYEALWNPSLEMMREDGGTPSLNHPPCKFVGNKKEQHIVWI